MPAAVTHLPRAPRCHSQLCRCRLLFKLQGGFGTSDPRSGSSQHHLLTPKKGSSQTLLLLHLNHLQIPYLNFAPTPQTRRTKQKITALYAPNSAQIFSVPSTTFPQPAALGKLHFPRAGCHQWVNLRGLLGGSDEVAFSTPACPNCSLSGAG